MSTESTDMRARTITTTTRRARSAQRRVSALALGVCALAIPASASASAGLVPASAAAQVPASAAAQVAPASATSQVPPEVPHGADYSSISTTEPSRTASGDEFDWGDASVGAGAVMALVALSGTVLFAVRRRPGISPSAWTG